MSWMFSSRSAACLGVLGGCLLGSLKPGSLRAQEAPEPVGAELRLNQIQLLGSHNSYRLATHPPLLSLLTRMSSLLPKGLNAGAWDYSHEPLPRQFSDYGVRSVELDVYLDQKGGLFARRQGNRLVGESVRAGERELEQPGMKVLHFPDLDYRTNYLTFRSALEAVKDWSDGHPEHTPLFIHLETKDESGHGRIPLQGLAQPETWDANAATALDAEIAAVFPRGRCFIPADLRGEYPSLVAAARNGNWPRWPEVRGKVIFVMEGSAKESYARGHTALMGRTSFLYASRAERGEDSPFLLMNDPVRQQGEIQKRVREGYVVRTRADADTESARTGETRRREAAWASGAQIVSTDYYRPDPRAGQPGWSDYVAKLPSGGVIRGNPVSAPEVWQGKRLE